MMMIMMIVKKMEMVGMVKMDNMIKMMMMMMVAVMAVTTERVVNMVMMVMRSNLRSTRNLRLRARSGLQRHEAKIPPIDACSVAVHSTSGVLRRAAGRAAACGGERAAGARG